MKKAIIISYYEWYEKRLKYLKMELINNQFEVKYFTANFNHHKKEKITKKDDDKIYIDVPIYKKNISLKRIISLVVFSNKVTRLIKREQPDLVYCIIPPNYLSKKVSNLKKQLEFKLIYDVIDMWPESLPINFLKDTFIFKSWRNLRNNISFADYVVTECDRYQEVLNKTVIGSKLKTIRIANNIDTTYIFDPLDKDILNLCYLGSINNIIDINSIENLIIKLQQYTKVQVHIIGDGENREKLIRCIKDTGATVQYYGKIFDENKKKEIFNKCHYGLNLYSTSTLIGLTIKSVDYLSAGLPVINNIDGDTRYIIEKYRCGINIDNINKNIIYSNSDYKNHVRNVAISLFDERIIKEQFHNIVELVDM